MGNAASAKRRRTTPARPRSHAAPGSKAAARTVRPAHKRQAGSRPAGARTPIRWDRVGRVALLGMLVVILLLYVPPVRHWIAQRQIAAAEAAELRRLEGEHARLKARLDALSRPDAIEREARRLGMVRRGEQAFVIENLPR